MANHRPLLLKLLIAAVLLLTTLPARHVQGTAQAVSAATAAVVSHQDGSAGAPPLTLLPALRDLPVGDIITVAGNGAIGYRGDRGLATKAVFRSPDGIAVDGAGNLYIADSYNDFIRKVAVVTGIITTVVGNGHGGYSGDGGQPPRRSSTTLTPLQWIRSAISTLPT